MPSSPCAGCVATSSLLAMQMLLGCIIVIAREGCGPHRCHQACGRSQGASLSLLCGDCVGVSSSLCASCVGRVVVWGPDADGRGRSVVVVESAVFPHSCAHFIILKQGWDGVRNSERGWEMMYLRRFCVFVAVVGL